METKDLVVTGMDCGGCEEAIGRALARLDGVDSCSASFEAGSVRVAYDPARVGVAEISQAIADAGYEVAGTG